MFQDWQYETLWTGFWVRASGQEAEDHKRDYAYHLGQSDLVTVYRMAQAIRSDE
jgi:hypothetical protein